MRALEQMAERSNIVDPREVTTEELLDKGYEPREYENELVMEQENLPGVPTPKKGGRRRRGAGPMDGAFDATTPVPYVKVEGSGATPTMGLSQVRGGAKHHEAHAMGRKLRAYLESLHGGAYAEAFGAGCGAGMRGGADCAKTEEECAEMSGTYFEGECYGLSDAQCAKPGPEPGPEPPGPEERTAPTWTPQTHYKLGEVVYVESDAYYPDNQPGYYKAKMDSTNLILQHPGKKASTWEFLGTSYTPPKGSGRMVGGLENRSGNIQQSGSFEGLGRRVAGGNMSGTADVTGGHCPSRAHLREEVTGKGKACGGKKRRAPAGASDGRRARAEIVKKVMREKGLKMIEASKYVKQHNLY
jgi:hypothetical protein